MSGVGTEKKMGLKQNFPEKLMRKRFITFGQNLKNLVPHLDSLPII